MAKGCPFCENLSEVKIEEISITFRKEEYHVFQHYYFCQKCKEEFTTTELDELNIKQVYNQYRDKHKILNPEQIRNIRENYSLSATKMSELLGLGINMYAKYEKGEIPNTSNSNLINTISKPENFRDFIIDNQSLFSDNEYRRLLNKIGNQIEQKETDRILCYYWKNTKYPSEYNGYRVPEMNKVANMIIYFSEKLKPFIVKLNKLLFYSDFYHFKNFGNSISGAEYAAINLGPVPNNYKQLYLVLEQHNFFETEDVVFPDEGVGEKFIGKESFKAELFEKDELNTLEIISKKFENLTGKQMVDLSHQEEGWIKENEKKGLISYQKYGFLLKGVDIIQN